jgi:hypothetical protein
MSKAIGFRVEPAAVHWAIVTMKPGEEPILEQAETIKAPKDSEEGAALSWFRGRVSNLLEQHKPGSAAIKYAEQIAPGRRGDAARKRARLEGVLLQLCDESRITPFTGAYKAVSGRLQTTSAKNYLKQDNVRGINWTGHPLVRREAILVALAALEGEV